ncbi:hypothetical protein L195_g025642 [Trifolium pratense]|uniref:Uncharacterized protein n=1 Tax=Trifolium pratense TaxID=57577 RepID=A0A2K3NH29_TRIPR|nr:hypothetical protein L195_g025642 [Trifolium pratense]
MASTAVATADSPQHPITEPSPSSVDRNDSSNSSPNFFADAEFQDGMGGSSCVPNKFSDGD